MKSVRSVVPSIVLLLLAAWVLPGAGAQSNPGGDTPGRPEIAGDAQACADQAAGRTDVICTVLYGHIFDLLQAVPINVQFPNAACADLARGFTSTPTIEPFFDQAQMDLFSSPGFVEYELGQGDCAPRLHPERGLTKDVVVDRTIAPVFYWYLSADTDDVSILGDPDQPDAGVMPCVKVRVTLQTGRFFGEGTSLSQGEAVRTIASAGVAPSTPTPAPDPCAAGPLVPTTISVDPVTEFAIQMAPVTADLPKIEAFVVHVEWWQVDQAGDSAKAAQREWNVHTGADFRSRLVLPVLNPLFVEEVRPQLFEDKIYVHGVFNSPWGSYDVDIGSIKLEIVAADGTVSESGNLGEPILRFSVDHDAHFKPVNATFPWDFLKDNLAPGTYKIRMSVQNWQHTAGATDEATVELPNNYASKLRTIKIISSEGIQQKNIVGKRVGGGGPGPKVATDGDKEGAPGFESAGFLLAALVAAAAFAVRRRR